jgi:hypothetical protein
MTSLFLYGIQVTTQQLRDFVAGHHLRPVEFENDTKDFLFGSRIRRLL